MIDYAEILPRIEKALGDRYRGNPDLFNVPGISLACKVDPFTYVALRPAFVDFAAKWAGVSQKDAEQTLVRTGNLLVDQDRKRLDGPLEVLADEAGPVMRLVVDFVPAAFIDRAVVLYGGEPAPPPVSRLRVHPRERQRLAAFFSGKTPLLDLAFAPAGTTSA
ncbi:hypothetical protein [Desulfolutivibrio sulfoxidireducens]|uniref:hypothetical protein n=1 Tax=Desulfolutivibrio sulfoxidireducens TaxID=2773299 RepID=UPI00159D272C|nr:hypothetical protein [Desulfolutivibrio sulfoxidireducens]QLA17623.1 hypothetical protein GD605_16825 [Desulfolutivibrio sulfoxidireducens]QLA21199.1 hypothetical protein GD604_16450 [Desulfolutivibrio sulfoxidireducens]